MRAFPGGSVVKNLPAKQEMWIQSLGWEDPLEKEMAFLPGKSHGQRSLASYSPCSHKELDTTEQQTCSKNIDQIDWLQILQADFKIYMKNKSSKVVKTPEKMKK